MTRQDVIGVACLVALVLGALASLWADRAPGAGPRPWWYRALMMGLGLVILALALKLLS